jgi:hypothetical protein
VSACWEPKRTPSSSDWARWWPTRSNSSPRRTSSRAG